MPEYISTRSNANEDAHRDFDGFDIDEELKRLLAAVEEVDPPVAFICEAVKNIHEHLRRWGPLPQAWKLAQGSKRAWRGVLERLRQGVGAVEPIPANYFLRHAAEAADPGLVEEHPTRPRPPNTHEQEALGEWIIRWFNHTPRHRGAEEDPLGRTQAFNDALTFRRWVKEDHWRHIQDWGVVLLARLAEAGCLPDGFTPEMVIDKLLKGEKPYPPGAPNDGPTQWERLK